MTINQADLSVTNPNYELGQVNNTNETVPDTQFFESDPSHLPLGVSIQNMVKIYKNGKKVAVDGLSLNFYENQITSFLGHNGAGKTTTMSILTGLFPPTSGTAYVYNQDILTNIDQIRKNMGMCPQHNVLFDHLTVDEHLWFYARLKGMSNLDVKTEMRQMIKDVGLPHKRDEKAKHLSGGMKRKLSVAIAFVGGSRVVILDEPTAGVDPYARRSIWDLLSKFRKGRTVILTTHHMDEADLLGDRIAIISQGKLKCCGSSMFLKSQFGNGYYLVLVKKSNRLSWAGSASGIADKKKVNHDEDITDTGSDEGLGSESSSRSDSTSTTPLSLPRLVDATNAVSYCDEGLVTRFIQSHIPGAEIAETNGTELTYLLPSAATRSGGFERLFNELDKNMDKLCISSYGISDTTLEEIFLKVADDDPDKSLNDEMTDTGRIPGPFLGIGSLRRKQLNTQSKQSESDKRKLLSDAELGQHENVISSTTNVTAAGDSTVFPPQSASLEPSDSSFGPASSANPATQILDMSIKAKACRAMDVITRPLKPSGDSSVVLVKYDKNNPEPSSPSEGSGYVEFPKSLNHHMDNTQDAESDTESCFEDCGDLKSMGSYQITGARKIVRQFEALFIKRFHGSRRNLKAFIAQVLVPVFFVLLMLACSLLVPPIQEEPALQIMPWIYTDRQLQTFYSQDAPNSEQSLNLEQNLHYTPGIGTRCMVPEPTILDLPCMKKEATDWMFTDVSQSVQDYIQKFNLSNDMPSPPCSCDIGTQVCEAEAGGPKPTYRVTQTTEIMNNLTQRNITDYLMKTYNDYIQERFGGLSFIDVNSLAVNQDILQNAMNNVTEMVNRNMTENLPEIDPSLIQKLYEVVSSMATLDNGKVWWDNTGWHALPIYINIFSNMLLRSNIAVNEDPAEYGITLYNHPMNRTQDQMDYILYLYASVDLGIAIFTVFALAFVPASFVVYLIQDKSSNAKHLQFVSGLNPTIYWITHFIWDLCNYCITAFLVIVIFVAFQKDSYVGGENLPCLVALLLLYGWAITPLMYPASYMFSVPSTAYVFLACCNIIIGMVATIATFILDYMDDEEDLIKINNVLKKVFLIFPHFCLGRGLLDMATNQLYADAFAQFGEDIFTSPFDWSICGKNLLCLGIEGFVFFGIVLLIQYGSLFHCGSCFETAKCKENIEEDEDVYQERQRVLSSESNEDLLKLHNLTKVYRSHSGKKNIAVDRICVGIPAGQLCTQMVLVIGNNDVILIVVGEWGIRKLGLVKYAQKRAGDYSGGNKRKLSTAISLIGNPQVVFLDEPTTGMDPKAKRFLWKCINSILKEGRSVILTSHSMEECEALCNRIAIMVNGRFQCLGSTQHLKNRFGDGYTLSIRIGRNAMDSVDLQHC
ncbi:phospholipid-transporting ATPase ABCA1-like [Saccoglossus kowalevskii]